MTRNKDILHCLPLLASVLARRYGVTVLVGGSQASTDGKTIHLPSLPIDCDDEWLALVRGYVDHESAHIRHTDFSAFRNAQLDTVTGNIFNALEDWRVEKCLSAIFPGCRRNLDWLIRRFFTELPTQAGEISPACVVSRHVLLTVRSWDVPEVAAALQVSRMALTALSQESARRIEGILEKVRSHCPDTLATINYARQLAACIPGKQRPCLYRPPQTKRRLPPPTESRRLSKVPDMPPQPRITTHQREPPPIPRRTRKKQDRTLPTICRSNWENGLRIAFQPFPAGIHRRIRRYPSVALSLCPNCRKTKGKRRYEAVRPSEYA